MLIVPNHGSTKRRAFLAVFVLTVACVAFRLPGLRALPVFGDEAIHLHWAELIRENPSAYAFVSLQAPKPPLHSWLLALALPLSSDPVRSGRLLGVGLAALTIPFVLFLCKELVTTLGKGPTLSPQRAAIASGVLFTLCPYLSFHQRLAMVEPLFLLEAVAAAWLALKVGGPTASPRTAVALGLWMGAAMLTRQNVSYLLWLLPVLGYVLRPRQTRARPRRLVLLLAVSAALSVLVWVPMLLVRQGPGLFDRLFHTRLLVEPMTLRDRLAMGGENARAIAGWFWTYLTPPVCLFALGAFAWLWGRGQRRLVAFLAGWLLVTLLPFVFFGRFLFSRYGITAVLPLLLAAGAALAWPDEGENRSPGRWRGKAALLALTGALLLWPLYAIFLQATRWIEQPLVSLDRWQFVSGWPAGFATERSVEFFRALAREKRIVLFIPRNEGNPMDTLWLSFWHNPSVLSFSLGDVFTEPLLRVGASPGSLLVDANPRRREPSRSLVLPSSLPIYTASPDPILTLQGRVAARELLLPRNPRLQEIARFWNPAPRDLATPTDGIVVYRLR
jgi:4-amino-4-deoxy-L-arabinose transferase-like glycosyltransferase